MSSEYYPLVAGVNGLRMLGIVHEAVIFLLEQLYGSRHCHNYRFRFHKPDEPDEPSINPHGSARAEINHRLENKIYTIHSHGNWRSVHHVLVITANTPSSHTPACVSDFRRCVFDMFSFLASKHRQPPEYRPHEDDGDEGQLRTARYACTGHVVIPVSDFLLGDRILVAVGAGASPWNCR